MTKPSEHAKLAVAIICPSRMPESERDRYAERIQRHAIDPAVEAERAKHDLDVAELVDLVSRLRSLALGDVGETDSPLDIEARKALERHK